MLAYLLLRDNTQSGPYSLEELKEAGIQATDLLWIEGRSIAWHYPDEIEELQAFVHAGRMSEKAAPMSNSALQIHHVEDEGKNIRQGNQAGILPFLQTETNPMPKEDTKEEKIS